MPRSIAAVARQGRAATYAGSLRGPLGQLPPRGQRQPAAQSTPPPRAAAAAASTIDARAPLCRLFACSFGVDEFGDEEVAEDNPWGEEEELGDGNQQQQGLEGAHPLAANCTLSTGTCQSASCWRPWERVHGCPNSSVHAARHSAHYSIARGRSHKCCCLWLACCLPAGQEQVEILEQGPQAGQQGAQTERPRITTRYLTKYEKARVLGTRALQVRRRSASQPASQPRL